MAKADHEVLMTRRLHEDKCGSASGGGQPSFTIRDQWLSVFTLRKPHGLAHVHRQPPRIDGGEQSMGTGVASPFFLGCSSTRFSPVAATRSRLACCQRS